MFTIIGGDGKEYGPVTTEQARAWITAGRANLDTKAKAAGSEEWRRLGDFAEFGGAAGLPPVMNALPTATAIGDVPAPAAELAGRGVRFGAFLLDQLIGCVCALPGIILLGRTFVELVLASQRGVQPDLENLDLGRMLLGGAVMGFALLALAVVQIWMLSTRGQTIAKRILGIAVVTYADGGKAGFVNAWLMRSFVPGIISAIPYIGTLFWLVDICFIFGDQRRCLHDLMAGTKVVKLGA